MTLPRVATVGDNCIDRYAPPLAVSTVGGNAVNVAVRLRELGTVSAYFGAVGDDAAGRRVLAALDAAGVERSHVQIVAGHTATTDLVVDASGERVIGAEDFGACHGYRVPLDDLDRLAAMAHVHIGWLADGGELRRRLGERGVSVSKDLAVNPGAQGLDIAFASAGADRAYGEALIGNILAEGARVAVVTLGAMGSMASDGREAVGTSILPVDVVDTTGAGDSFIAGFVSAHLKGDPLGACLEAARRAAAETCTHIGGFRQVPVSQ